LLVVALTAGRVDAAPGAPADFVIENAAPHVVFNTPTAIAFVPDGRLLVAEKRGVVWVVENGRRLPDPLWSAETEVLNSGDRGLVGLAVDPNYAVNHAIYFFYTVDPDSNGVDDDGAAFGRLTRFRTLDADSNRIDPASRTVLIGATWRDGIPSASASHSVDCLRFGEDGSLLVTAGDGAHYDGVDDGGRDSLLFTAGRTDALEDIGSYRAQYLGSLAGKLLRVNPETGFGYAGNPYAGDDLGAPAARVWAYGFRNPFRFCVRPGSGSADTAAARPGIAFVGDVGLNAFEEINAVDRAGKNLGWPCYEGRLPQLQYASTHPAHHGCGSVGTPENPELCSPPLFSWSHVDSTLSVPYGLKGNCTAGGIFYTGDLYPAQYRGRLFFGDFGRGWLRVATLDSTQSVVQMQDFASGLEGPVDWAADPRSGDLYYLSIYTGEVRRIRYAGTDVGDEPPVARASASTTIGVAPTTVELSSLGSYDPGGHPLSFSWDFDDGTVAGATLEHPVHVYQGPGAFHPVLTVSNTRGMLARDTLSLVIAKLPGFPTTAVLDSFARPDAPLAMPWTGGISGFGVREQALAVDAMSGNAIWNGGVFGANQEAFFRFDSIAATAPEHDLLLKVQGTSWTSGALQVVYSAPQAAVVLTTYDPETGFSRRGGPWPVRFQPGDQFGARAYSNGVLLVYRNGEVVGSASYVGWPFAAAGGRVGMMLNGAAGARLQAFGGGDVLLDTHVRPRARIESPRDGAFFHDGETVVLAGSTTDADDAPGSVTLRWDVDLLHNNHVHPSAFVSNAAVDSMVMHNHDDGTGVHEVIRLVATDPGGLADTARVSIYPEIDLVPSPIQTTPTMPCGIGTTRYAFTLGNRGRMPAPFSRWALRAGAITLAAGDTLVAALDSVRIVVELPSLPPAAYDLRVVVDTLGAVTETDESNNAFTQTFARPDFPTTPLLDAFQRADAPLAAPWVGSLGGLAIVDRALAQTSNTSYAVWNGGVFGPDQEAYFAFDAVTPTSPEHDLLLKVQGSSWTSGAIQVTYSVCKSTVVVNTYTPGLGWERIGQPWTVTFGPGDRLGARAMADGRVRVYRNGLPLGEVTVAAWAYATRGGRIGLMLGGAQSSRIVDFGGGNTHDQDDPPVAAILAPLSGYPYAGDQRISVDAAAVDSRDSLVDLRFRWESRVRTALFAEPFVPFSEARTDSFTIPSRADTAGARIDLRLIVTDLSGGADTTTVEIMSRQDLEAGPDVVNRRRAPRLTTEGPQDSLAAPLDSARVAPAPALPAIVSLSAPYPNPARGAVSLALELPSATMVETRVLDVLGRVVWSEPPRAAGAGRWVIGWAGRDADGRPAPAGTYFVCVGTHDARWVRRVTLLR
jgi:glucose/arabinose dehydrogenase/PKD repeat protein